MKTTVASAVYDFARRLPVEWGVAEDPRPYGDRSWAAVIVEDWREEDFSQYREERRQWAWDFWRVVKLRRESGRVETPV